MMIDDECCGIAIDKSSNNEIVAFVDDESVTGKSKTICDKSNGSNTFNN